MPHHPAIATLTPAPLRNRIRLALQAPPAEVWALIGDPARFPEYSAGLDRVDSVLDANGRCTDLVRWYEPGYGYASSGTPNNAFGLSHDLNLVTLESSPEGTLLTWDEYFEAKDLEAMRVEFDQAFADIADRLIARFGGHLIERFARRTDRAAGPRATVGRLTDAMNRGDIEAAAALYEPDAVLIVQPGAAARGDARIREALQGFIQLRPTLTTSTSHVLDAGDVALYFGRWQLTGIGPDGAPVTMDGESADVLRRHSNGDWLVALDNPWGTAVLPDG